MKKILILFLITVSVFYGQSKTGSTAAPFLNIAMGAHAISMGGAFSATANDVSTLYWNPAGMSRLNNNEAMFTQSTWFADISYNWSGAVIKLDANQAIGLSVTYLDYGDMEITTLSEQSGTGQMFTASDMALGLSYGFNITDRFSIGATVKYIQQKIWNTSASAVAVDIGTLFYSDLYGIKIGATISNFGTDMKMDGKDLLVQYDIDPQNYGNNDQILAVLRTDEFPLPLTFRVGIAKDFFVGEDHQFTLGVDALHPSDNDESLNVGGEYVYDKMISLRVGYKSLFLDNSEEGLTAGFGVFYEFAPNLGIYFDYAYQDYGIFENTQHFALGVRF